LVITGVVFLSKRNFLNHSKRGPRGQVLEIPSVVWEPGLVGNVDFTISTNKVACIEEKAPQQLLVQAESHSIWLIII